MAQEAVKADGKTAPRKILIMALCLLLIIMSFTGFVNYLTFADNYNKALVNTYSVAGNELVRKIEYALFYGKPIDNYYGMNDTLKELTDVISEVTQVNIVSPEGDILYDLQGFVRERRLPPELLKAAVFAEGTVNESLSYRFWGEKAYLFLRIEDNTPNHIASLVMVFPRDVFLHPDSYFTKQLVLYLIAIALISLAVLALVFMQVKFFTKDNLINKRLVLFVFISILGSAQLVYSGINYFLFRNAYLDMAYTSKTFIENTVAKNVESVYAKGLSLQNLEGFEGYLHSIEETLPQIADLGIVQGRKITAVISNAYIDRQMFKILLDMLTVLIISVFFMIELTLLAVIIMTRDQTGVSPRQESGVDVRTGHGLIRSLTFLINICSCMSLTFVPLVMKNIYRPLGGLPQDVVLGLPLSAEMLGGVAAIMLAGRSIGRQGWRAVFYRGAFFLALGNFLAAFSDSAVLFIMVRAVAGLGLGYILMTIRSLAVSLPERSAAIAEFGAGSLAGLNCGAVMGGMLADRVGYAAVFCLAAGTAVMTVIFVKGLMTEFEIQPKATGNIRAGRSRAFRADRKTIIFLTCVFIPFFISGAFLDYYFPLFSASQGLTQSDISRGILLNGIFIIYLGPVLTRFVGKYLDPVTGLTVATLIVVAALAGFTVWGSVAAAFLTVICLGIAESFGVSLQTTYFLNLEEIRNIEINKGIAYFSVMVNLSRTAGPIIYGMALSLGMQTGVGLISLAVFILLLIFIFSGKYRSVADDTRAAG
ncbi:MAG: MFS transporter [Peptococcaceae bacterium]